jgi:hypothetical protein
LDELRKSFKIGFGGHETQCLQTINRQKSQSQQRSSAEKVNIGIRNLYTFADT